jgi:predicted acylesterase/phospholipase RssA
VQAVDLNTGEIFVFDETMPKEDRAQTILAGGSIPLIFEPVEDLIDTKALVDGGTYSNLELDEGILKCREQGFDDKDIIVDVILCHD